MTEAQRIAAFWQWFSKIEVGLYEAGDRQSDAMVELIKRIKQIDPGLMVDWGLEDKGKREMVVTSLGVKSKMAMVMRVVAAAPVLKRWRVVAFRQRRPVHMTLRYQGVGVKTTEAFFSYRVVKGIMRVRVFFLDWLDLGGQERVLAMTMVENLLGEYDTAMRVMVEVGGRVKDKGGGEQIRPLIELPRIFDEVMGSD